MKSVFQIFILGFLLISCSKESNTGDESPNTNIPEGITTVRLLLFPTGAQPFQLSYRDVDLNGPGQPEVMTQPLDAGTTYRTEVTLSNESVLPAQDINTLVNTDKTNYQIFYLKQGGIDATFEVTDLDVNSQPVGLGLNIIAGNPSSGELRIIVIYGPTKNFSNDPISAGGTTLADISIPITIQ